MVCFDDYLDNAIRVKTMRGNVITTFLLHVSQCITLNQTKFVTATIIYEAPLKSLNSRLEFKVIKDFAPSANPEEAREQFHYEPGKKKEKKNDIKPSHDVLQLFMTTELTNINIVLCTKI